MAILLTIVGFIFKNGYKLINLNYLLSGNNSVTQYVVINSEGNIFVKPSNLPENSSLHLKITFIISLAML